MNATLAPTHGLDALVKEIEFGSKASVVASWSRWYEQAISQLENDDTIDARYTDALAEELDNIDAALADQHNAESAFRGLLNLYHSHEQAVTVEARWHRKIAGLGALQLETELWNDLHRALAAAEAGKRDLVAHWLDDRATDFRAAWSNYRNSDVLLCEVTEESRAGHRLLGEGISAWLEAIVTFRAGLCSTVDKAAVLSKAETGQRLLVGLQVIEQEDQDCVDRFARAWAN